MVCRILPQHYEHACGCRPKVAVSSAQNFLYDRFLAVGDAAVSRLYKDGIGSSLLTARQAAFTVIHHGISQVVLEKCYLPLCQKIARDNWWGHQLFSINRYTKNSRLFLLTQCRLIGNEQKNTRAPQPFTKAAWGMFTGSYTYQNISRMILNPVSLLKLAFTLFRESFKHDSRYQEADTRRVHIGKRKVLILGSGFGGIYVLRHLVRSLNRNENVATTLISDENFFLFSPLLHEVATGRIETRHIAYPIRKLHWRDRFNFFQANIGEIDLPRRRVITTQGSFDFDYLVLALGSVTDTSELERLGPEQQVFTLKTLHDSRLIKNRIIELFERASTEDKPEIRKRLLTFVVCGGGYTGVQLVTEFHDFVYRSLLKFYWNISVADVRILLIEKEARIAAELHSKLGTYVKNRLQHMDLEVRLKSRVTRIWAGGLELNGAEIVPTNMIIWVTGVVAHPLIAALPVQRDDIGRVMVDDYLQLSGTTGFYAVGDCAHYKDPHSGSPIPPRAHTAVRQARIVAHNILADIRGQDREPYHYTNTAEAISLGSSDAAVRFFWLRFYGFFARLVWLVSYSSLVTGTPNRIRIIMDWLLSWVFGRDVTYIR